MKPAAFEYHKARSASGAVALLVELGDEAKVIAGGQSLVPMMNVRLARPSALVDVSRLSELAGFEPQPDGSLRIGALTRHSAFRLAALPPEHALLADAARLVGHDPIRTQGTFGGSLAHGDPAAEWCLLAVLLDADLTALGPSGERRIAAADFFDGFLTTALAPDELLTEIHLPAPGRHAAIAEYARRHGDFAVVSVAVSLDMGEAGACRSARVALGAVAPTPVRAVAAEAILEGGVLTPAVIDAAADAAAAAIDPPSDVHGTADHRRTLVRTLLGRAVRSAVSPRTAGGAP